MTNLIATRVAKPDHSASFLLTGKQASQKALTVCLFLWAAQASALNVTMTAKAEGGDKPVIAGTTNLPSGTELMITLHRKESKYMAQDKAKVKDGSFQAGPFSQKGASLNPGTYILEVTTPLAGFQPPATWPIIGNEGAKLQGPLAKKSEFGGKVVEYKTSIKIGSGQSSTVKDRAARAESEKDIHEWWLASCKDTCNISQNIARKRKETFNWERCYYRCVAEEPKK